MLKWAKSISLKEFAEKYVHLPSNSPFNARELISFYLTPHLIKVLESVDNGRTQKITLMFASQMAKTTVLFIIFAKNAKMDGKDCVWMISKDKLVSKYQKAKIDSHINVSPHLRNMIEEARIEENRSANKIGELSHGGSHTFLIGSKVDDDKKSITAKLILVDEADEIDGLAAIAPLWQRAKTFLKVGAMMVIASTKKTKNGTITQSFNSCEQKNFLGMYCPHCSDLIEVVWTQFRIMEIGEFKDTYGYDDDTFTDEIMSEKYIPLAQSLAYYECNSCGESITSEQKDMQIKENKIEWIVKGNKKDPKTVGFSANSFLSYFLSFEDIATSYLEAIVLKDPALRRDALKEHFEGYYNEPYEEEIKETVKKSDILRISNGLEENIIPDDTYKIFMDIDTQLTHFWFTITAWQYGSICNVVDYGRAESFEELDIIRKKLLTDRHGQIRYVDHVTIDSRGVKERTKLVLEWVQLIDKEVGRPDYIYASEGESGQKMIPMFDFRTIKGTTTKILKINNLQAKLELTDMINRSIERIKHDDGEVGFEESQLYKERMFWINNKPVRLFDERIEKNISSKREDFERMMTSEHYIYHTNPETGKTDNFKSYQKINESVRNDLYDCIVSSVTRWHSLSYHLVEKPRELTKREIRLMDSKNVQYHTPNVSENDHF